MLQEEQTDRDAFAAELDGFSDNDLMVFVPDVIKKTYREPGAARTPAAKGGQGGRVQETI